MQTLGGILAETQKLISENPGIGLQGKLESMKTDYQYLIDFMRKGYKDDKRETLYQSMTKNAWMLLADAKFALSVEKNAYLKSLVAGLKNVETSSSGLIELLQNKEGNRQQILSDCFNSVLVSGQWKEQDSRLWLSWLISDETSENDSCIMVSAIMLSAYVNFSFEKFRTLAYVFDTADNERLKQRALVGLMLTWNNDVDLYRKEQNEILKQLAEDNDDFCESVLSVLMQMCTLNHSEEANEKINKELIPKISKANMLQMTKNGLDLGGSSIEEILNPGESERQMEEMEASIKKVSDMQSKGVDIFFKGFSQMKRYPFFYKIVNWFEPFNLEHPELQASKEKLEGLRFLKKALSDGPFCDSDKYSFSFAILHVLDQLPEKMKEFLNRDDIAPIGTADNQEEIRRSPQYIRRMHLQDLYRFFKLFPQNKFEDAFAEKFQKLNEIVECLGDGIQPKLHDYCTFMIRHGEQEIAGKIALSVKDETQRNVLLGTLLYSKGDYAEAFEKYGFALTHGNNEKKILLGYAKCAMACRKYKEAAAAYDQLKSIDIDNQNHSLNYVIAMTYQGNANDVVNEAYRLDYEMPDDIRVKRVLGWTLLLAKRQEQAMKVLSEIVAEEEKSESDSLAVSDLMNLAYAEWFSNDIENAIMLMVKGLGILIKDNDKMKMMSSLRNLLEEDKVVFVTYNATETTIDLMLDAVCESIK